MCYTKAMEYLCNAMFLVQILYERMEKEMADTEEPETEARRRATDEEEALLKVGISALIRRLTQNVL